MPQSPELSSASSVQLRFLLFPRGEEMTRTFSQVTEFGSVKQQLVSEWQAIEGSSENDIRFIHCGKVVSNNQTVFDVVKICQPDSIITIHVVSKRPNLVQQQTNANVNNTSTAINEANQHHHDGHHQEGTNETEFDWDNNIHFHGCFFDEDELNRLRQVFDQKLSRRRAERNNQSNQTNSNNNSANQAESSHDDDDSTISFTDVHQFLRVYWRWMQRNNHQESDAAFPMEHLMTIKRTVLRNSTKVDFLHFLEIFFLFDNRTPEERCPHGHKDRVKSATNELHRSLIMSHAASTIPTPMTRSAADHLSQSKPANESSQDQIISIGIFDEVFALVDTDGDGMLSCKELELFFYLYSAQVVVAEQAH